VEKPGTAFFDKMVGVSGYGCGETAYVGDRLDNDIAPAAQAGLFTVDPHVRKSAVSLVWLAWSVSGSTARRLPRRRCRRAGCPG
jgi:FMN phosphatase YigB (HAD superfamily)